MVYSPLTFEQAIIDRKSWGRILESSVGAYLYLVSQAFTKCIEVFYWHELVNTLTQLKNHLSIDHCLLTIYYLCRLLIQV